MYLSCVDCVHLVAHLHTPKLCATLCVYSFYESNDISHVMPGKKDFISVEEEKCKDIQKRLVLSDLRAVYLEFKDKIPWRLQNWGLKIC